MNKSSLLLLALTLLPFPALAASDANIGGQQCSGELSVSVSDSIAYVCAGNLSLIDGTLTSDQLVSISAEGDILMENLTISAPLIELTSTSGTVSLDTDSALITDEFKLNTSGGLSSTISVYAQLTLTSRDEVTLNVIEALHIYVQQEQLLNAGGLPKLTPVPLPTPALLLLSGLLPLMFGTRKRA